MDPPRAITDQDLLLLFLDQAKEPNAARGCCPGPAYLLGTQCISQLFPDPRSSITSRIKDPILQEEKPEVS